MSPRITPLLASAILLGIGLAAAAPIPKHLMPKDPPLSVPTRVGTTWVYDYDGQERTVVIAKVEDKDGAKVVTTEWVAAGGQRSPHMIQQVSEKGVFLVAESGSAYDAPWCILEFPHREGRVWEIDARQRGSAVHVGTMTAGPVERVKTPAGEFTAAKVTWKTAAAGTGIDWYADGIGLVRTDGRPMIALKSFTPGKG